ncbi:hypothetical protein AB0O75_19985 [Streptomyces sp. NPDC088921]|uniref:hypothetical protein n=1 Tax=unclassified Streptomyces TaxID=2593676 RepID=UPI003434C061
MTERTAVGADQAALGAGLDGLLAEAALHKPVAMGAVAPKDALPARIPLGSRSDPAR